MVTLQFKLDVPDNLLRGRIPPDATTAALKLAAQAAKRDCVANFDRQGYEEPPGVFHRWKPLSEATYEMSRGEAVSRVGGRRSARIRYQKTAYGELPVAYGKGGEQRSARVRRFPGAKILIDTGRLRASLLGGVNHIERASADEIVVGTNVEYAAVHERGAQVQVTERQRKFLGIRYGVWVKRGTVLTIPARPYLRLSREGIEAVGRQFLQELARRGFGGTR
jgi:phage gpG-like protein